MRTEQSSQQRHLDGFITHPSIYLNDEPFIENGYAPILQDKNVRRVAAKYGDPDELLTPSKTLKPIEEKGD
jgi:hypothetical protein